MNEPSSHKRKLLEAFLTDNDELERLESISGEFNIFTALAAERQELRHSAFLAFLLDPRQNHGLGDEILKPFLQRALSAANREMPISGIEVDVWDLAGAEVVRESENIDILVSDQRNRLAIVIENKIDSSEHSSQLERYRERAERRYPDWKIVYVFLTKDGTEPADDAYVALDYGRVAEALGRILNKRASTLV